jgi:hypothetical protein
VLAASLEFVTSSIVCRRRIDSASDGELTVMSILVVDRDERAGHGASGAKDGRGSAADRMPRVSCEFIGAAAE